MAKEMINKMKRQHTNCEKIFANHRSDKGLISEIYKELRQLNRNKNEQLNKKMGRGYEQTFFQRRYTDGQQAQEKTFNITNS